MSDEVSNEETQRVVGALESKAPMGPDLWTTQRLARTVIALRERHAAEAIAAERERCARVCDGLADEAQREVSEARGDTLAVEWFKGRRSGARECAAKIRAGGV